MLSVIRCGATLLVLMALVHLHASAQGAPIALFDGESLRGWEPYVPDAANAEEAAAVWEIRENGVLHCKGSPTGYIRTAETYSDYKLALEWRWPGEGGNSGVLLHVQGENEVWPKSIEAQLHSTDAGDIWVIGGTTFDEHTDKDNRRVVKMHESNEKPLGEWNRYEIYVQGGAMKLYVNGLLQNEATGTSVQEGAIGLQSEGTPIQFRNVILTPLPAASDE